MQKLLVVTEIAIFSKATLLLTAAALPQAFLLKPGGFVCARDFGFLWQRDAGFVPDRFWDFSQRGFVIFVSMSDMLHISLKTVRSNVFCKGFFLNCILKTVAQIIFEW